MLIPSTLIIQSGLPTHTLVLILPTHMPNLRRKIGTSHPHQRDIINVPLARQGKALSITMLCTPTDQQTIGVVTPPRRMENGRIRKQEEPIGYIASPWRKCDTPLWPVENGEWELPLPSACGKNLCSLYSHVRIWSPFSHPSCTFCSVDSRWKKQPQVKNNKTLHKKFSPFSILQSPRMGPPPFKESVPRPHSAFSENGKKEVWQPLITQSKHRAWIVAKESPGS
jgi:hypothetical protein